MKIRGRARWGRVVVVALLASVVMGSAKAQQLSIRSGGVVMPSQGFTVPSSMTGSLAPSVDIPGMPSVANGGFELPEPMKNVAVPGHKVEGKLFAPVALEKVKVDTSKGNLGSDGDDTTQEDIRDTGWGTIVWPQGDDALEWLTEAGQEWRNRAAVIAAWKYQRDLPSNNRDTYRYYQSLAAQYVEFQAGPEQKTLPPFFDYTRFASYENKQSASEDDLASFVEDGGSALVVTLINKSPFDLCVSYLTPSSEKIADRVSVTNPIHIAPNGVPTMIALRTLPGVLTAQDARLVFGIGNCADMESRHAQLRLVGFKVGPSSVDPNRTQEEEQPDDPGGGGCPQGTHLEQLSYRQSSTEEGWDDKKGLVWNEKKNAWSEKARPFMCVPDNRWDVLTASGVQDVCEYWFGDRAALVRHNTERYPSGIDWGVEKFDPFGSGLVVSVKNPKVCKCKEGWTDVGASADEVCRPACLRLPHTELAHRGGANSDPVCRCNAGYYYSGPQGQCVAKTVVTPCPKTGAANGNGEIDLSEGGVSSRDHT